MKNSNEQKYNFMYTALLWAMKPHTKGSLSKEGWWMLCKAHGDFITTWSINYANWNFFGQWPFYHIKFTFNCFSVPIGQEMHLEKASNQ